MTKINKEEYKFLKSLDDKWKWIARNYNGALITYTDKPMKNPNLYWDSFGERMEDRLFQFIQWGDEEPYEIAELIEEYEHKEFYDYVGWKYAESEEPEVNKDIQWLKREIHKELEDWHGVEGGIDGDGINEIMLLINQLDEPETLSEDWIQEHSYNVHLLGTPDVTTVAVPREDLQNLLVPKQELPVVPMWFDEWWKYATKGGGNLFHNMERFYDELFSSGTRETYEYISNPDNKKKLLNIIINELEYEVEEEEQKYIVSDNSSIPLLIKDDSGKVMSYDSQIAYNNSNGTIELTEQEIKDYDPRYWAFREPVGELEK